MWTLERLGLAYRKAKADLYFTDPPRRLDLAEYENNLRQNLEQLAEILKPYIAKPYAELPDELPGELVAFFELDDAWTVLPKSFRYCDSDDRAGCAADLDSSGLIFASPRDEWNWHLTHPDEGQLKPVAEFRLMSDCNIHFHVFSTLWLLEVGKHFDAKLGSCCYGNRLRKGTEDSSLNENATGTFQHYFRPYRKWRSDGLEAMQQALKQDKKIVALTTDVDSFYHRLDPGFMLDPEFTEDVLSLPLNNEEKVLHKLFIMALQHWAQKTPLGNGIPVGLPASAVIANVAMFEFDEIIRKEVVPLHYGRYVDDVILVVENNSGFRTAAELWNWLTARGDGKLISPEQNDKTAEAGRCGISAVARFTASYFEGNPGSCITFSSDKNKVFVLEGSPGQVLLGSIEKEMQARTSEWRSLPDLPEDSGEVPGGVVAATQKDGEPVDNLRKTDEIALRRSALSIQLSDFEDYAEDLLPDAWREHRKGLYKAVKDHLLVPPRYFEFRQYLPRIIGLAAACGDVDEVLALCDAVLRVVKEVEDNCQYRLKAFEPEAEDNKEFHLQEKLPRRWRKHVSDELFEAVLVAWPVQRTKYRAEDFVTATQWRKPEGSGLALTPPHSCGAEESMHQLFLADLARIPYRYALLPVEMTGIAEVLRQTVADQQISELDGLIPSEIFNAAKALAEQGHASDALTSGLVFPTRPLSEEELSLIIPPWCPKKQEQFQEVLSAMRGYGMKFPPGSVAGTVSCGCRDSNCEQAAIKNVPGVNKDKIIIAVANWRTDISSWNSAAAGKPDLSRKRYSRLNKLLNSLIRHSRKVDYFVLPELALPVRWYNTINRGLKKSTISLIAGVEYLRDSDGEAVGSSINAVSNEVWMSLLNTERGFTQSMSIRHQKRRPAWGEKKNLREAHNVELKPSAAHNVAAPHPQIIRHGDFHFAVLICSELSNIDYRAYLRGKIDALFVLKWNRDLNTFNALVESAALDVHCYVVQCNNRAYGDSRIRVPAKEDWARDLLLVKGGATDGFLVAEINIHKLRDFQSHHESPNREFKPVPEGFQLSEARQVTPGGR